MKQKYHCPYVKGCKGLNYWLRCASYRDYARGENVRL